MFLFDSLCSLHSVLCNAFALLLSYILAFIPYTFTLIRFRRIVISYFRRNLAHLLRDDTDRPRIVALDAAQWLADYEQAAGYTGVRRRLLRLVIGLHAGPAGRELLSGLDAPR